MKKKKRLFLKVSAAVLAVIAVLSTIFCTFGGFGTGDCADAEEFLRYSSPVSQIAIPDGVRVVALGEATHGSREFQELKLEVFKLLVEFSGVRAFALEGDFGGCEFVNRYIHGGEGNSREAAAAIGFSIYRTEEMAELIDWMREFNETHSEEQQLRFYGFDMQRYEYNYRYLISEAKALGIDTTELEALIDGDTLNPQYSNEERASVISTVKAELVSLDGDNTDFAVHHADILLQNIEMGKAFNSPDPEATSVLRDRLMAENILWISEQEEKLGNSCIFVTGHNGHLERNGTYSSPESKVTGHYLADELGENYFVIGTDFFRARVNLPSGDKRIKRSFYSHDPLAKAAKKCGDEALYLDFSAVPSDSVLRKAVDDYCFMGSLGESYMFIMKLVPYSYRVWRSPALTFDGVIYVPYAHASVIWDVE